MQGKINQKYTVQPSFSSLTEGLLKQAYQKKKSEVHHRNTFQHDLIGDLEMDLRGFNGSEGKELPKGSSRNLSESSDGLILRTGQLEGIFKDHYSNYILVCSVGLDSKEICISDH